MSVQFVSDASGKPTAVLVPIKEWERLQQRLQQAPNGKKSAPKLSRKEQLKAEFREGVQEMLRGEGRPFAELLAELRELPR